MEFILQNEVLNSRSYKYIIEYLFRKNKLNLLIYVPFTSENTKVIIDNYRHYNQQLCWGLSLYYLENMKLNNSLETYQIIINTYEEFKSYLDNFYNNFEENVANMTNNIYNMWFYESYTIYYEMLPQIDLYKIELWLDYLHYNHSEQLLDTLSYLSKSEPDFINHYSIKHQIVLNCINETPEMNKVVSEPDKKYFSYLMSNQYLHVYYHNKEWKLR